MNKIRNLLLFILFIIPYNLYAVTLERGHIDCKARIATSYLYRGTNYGGLSFQPQADFNYYGVNFNLWFNVGASDWKFTDCVSELDFQAGYEKYGFKGGLKCIYMISYPGLDLTTNTPKLEVYAGYDFLYDYYMRDHLWLTWDMYVYGNDYNAHGLRAYSTYIELSYKHVFWCDVFTNLNIGFTPWEGLYANHIAFVNLNYTAGYIFEYCDFSIAPYATVMINPDGINRDNFFPPANESFMNRKFNIAVGVDFKL